MSVMKNITLFVTAVVFAKGVGFAQSLVLSRSLGPVDFGIWVTLLLIISYSPIVSLGTMETMLKEVPYLLGRNDRQRVKQIEGSVFGSVLLASGTLFCLALLALAWSPQFASGDSLLLPLILFATSVSTLTSFFYWRLTTYENFKSVASLDASRSMIAFACIGVTAWLWGLKACVIGYVIHEIIMCVSSAICNLRTHGAVTANFSKHLLLHAVRVGFPITLLWWVLTLQATVDRVVLGSMLGPESVGYFGLGISLIGGLTLVPTAVGRVLYPRLNHQFGSNADPDSMKSLTIAPTLALGTIYASMQAVLVAIAPLLYLYLLPKYQPGLLCGQILLLGSFFGCLLRNGANYMIATHQEAVFLKYIFITLVFNVIADVCLVKLGWGIEGVAAGTGLAGFVLGTLVWRRVLIGLGLGNEIAGKIFELYLPATLLTIACGILWLANSPIYHQWGLHCAWTAVGLVAAINLSLLAFPSYRREMAGWKTTLLKNDFIRRLISRVHRAPAGDM